jgi:hypothetical protein
MKLSIAATALFSTATTAVVAATSGQTIIVSHTNNDNKNDVDVDASSSTTINFNPTDKKQHVMNQMKSARLNNNANSNKKALLQNKLRQALLNAQPEAASGATRKLRNLAASAQSKIECEPSSEKVDLGVLGVCGSTQYCMESIDSALGGYCVDVDSESSSFIVSQGASAGRHLQEMSPGGDGTLLDYVNVLCNETSVIDSPFVNCDCQLDDVAYTASAMCMTDTFTYEFATVCGDQVPNITFTYNVGYNLQVTAPYTGSVQTCYQLTVPEQVEYCYQYELNGLDSEPTCTMSLNGVDCTLCMPFLYETTDPLGLPQTLSCKQFDCTNTEFATSGSLCEDASLSEYIFTDILVYSYLPCPNACFLCGASGSYTSTPTAPFAGANNTCGLIELAALSGYEAVVDTCDTLSVDFQAACSCVAVR